MKPEPQQRPRLAAGCRLNDDKREPRTLLMPERALRIQGPSLQIVERCDGQRTVAQIVAELQALYEKAEPSRVERDVMDYLALLHEKRALDFDSGVAAKSSPDSP